MDKQRRKQQRILGLLLIVISLIGAAVLKDATAAVFLIPLGVYAVVTKEDILIHTSFDEE